jgi:uncharacterized repeat protein (TIGR02543 family)
MKKKMNDYIMYFALISGVLILLFITGCTGGTPSDPIINSFSASPSTIAAGESSTLSWSVTDASSVSIDNGVGSVDLTGTTTVDPATTTTYTLTATNASGSVTLTTTVTVASASAVATVTYHGNGHTAGTVPVDPSSPYEPGATVTVLDKGDLAKLGYTFAGWNTQADGSGTDQAEGSTFTIGASDVALYAKWTFNFTIYITYYTITFDSQGGSAVSSQMVEYGEKVTEPADPTRTGYTFGGWYTESGCTNAWDFADDTVTSGMTLYAKWTSYALRDTGPAGGLIFYIKEGGYSDGWMYLEACYVDQSASDWGCYGTFIPGADGTAVGTGEQNTIDIEAECTEFGTAANRCASLGLGGYNDWFLPSKDELNLMYVNLKVFGVGGFADDYYWSSSELNANLAWGQNFGDGGLGTSYKHYARRVRAVRAF